MTEREIKPCPRCGTVPHPLDDVEVESDDGEGDPWPLLQVVCPKCGTRGPVSTDAVDAWNTRAGAQKEATDANP